ncbi:MAG: Calx-beta domain-containing protein, partial [Burkholderiales bacterium]
MIDLMRVLQCLAASACLVLTACGGGGGDDGDAGGGAPTAGTVVGAAVGAVAGPSGASVVIPPGALAADTTIRIEQTSNGAPVLPGGFVVAGQTFAFTPHGTTFAVPVTMTLPFDPALVPAGSKPTLYKTNAQNQWEQVSGATVDAGKVSAQVTGFSFGTAGVERLPPLRSWSFFIDATGERVSRDDFNMPPWVKVEDGLSFGPEIPFFVDIGIDDDDKETRLDVSSSVEGVTFWASAEDVGDAGLTQTQAFIKMAPNATLQFVITDASLQAVDFNHVPTADECPRGLQVLTCHPLSARIDFFARAFGADSELLRDAAGKPLLEKVGRATLEGRAGLWAFDAKPNSFFDAAWSELNFLFTTDARGNPKARLTKEIVIDVDLSSIKVGTKFYVESNVFASAVNKRGRESAIGAYVRDPARSGGGAVNSTGLQLANDTVPPPPPPGLTAPVPCIAGPDPAAGVLQFSAATYEMLEDRFAGRRGIQVTRTQGSSGSISATFTTAAGGTAVPGVHYKPKTITVKFADGDTASRFVELDILTNADIEDDRTVKLVLSEPGGCATLGALSSSVLTILDDDRPAPPPPPSGLDTSFDFDGKASTTAFGGDRSAMALQADGKIVMVGGTFVDFVLARFNADGSLDTGFGIDGKVTTDMGSGLRTEEALAVAIQPDGK